MEGEKIPRICQIMSDEEFDVMDELYFVQPFSYLTETLSMEARELKQVLQSLLQKGYIKCFFNMNDEVFEDELNFEEDFDKYHYLASKKGLLAHNGL